MIRWIALIALCGVLAACSPNLCDTADSSRDGGIGGTGGCGTSTPAPT